MNNQSDRELDALFGAVREEPIDTSRIEYGFETRLMARLREERTPWLAISALAWKLCPFFAALALAAGLWSRMPSVRADNEAHVFAEAARGGEEHALLAYLTGDDEQ